MDSYNCHSSVESLEEAEDHSLYVTGSTAVVSLEPCPQPGASSPTALLYALREQMEAVKMHSPTLVSRHGRVGSHFVVFFSPV